jgi:hypothetical protein
MAYPRGEAVNRIFSRAHARQRDRTASGLYGGLATGSLPLTAGASAPPYVRLNHVVSVSSRARGRLLGRRFRSGGAGAQLWGLFGTSRSKRLAAGVCGVCALWHFRRGDRALDPWACGRRTARGQSWSPVLADSEARRRFLFGTWRSAVTELFGNSRSQQLAAAKPSDVARPSAIAP